MPSEIVERLKAGQLPPPVVALISKGAFPMPVEESVDALLHLIKDSGDEIRLQATKTLEGLAEATVLTLLRAPGITQDLMYFYSDAAGRLGRVSYLEALVQNVDTPDEYLAFLATRLPPNLLDVLVTNQMRLIRHPQIMDAIEMNPQAGRDVLRRVREVREEFFLKKQAQEKQESIHVGPSALVKYGEKAVDTTKTVKGEALARILPKEVLETLEPEEMAEGLSPQRLSVYQKIVKMNVPDRQQLALKGTKEERSILIKDPNKVVVDAVLSSPKLTDTEVETYSTMRNLSEDVVRKIAMNREWVRNYKVMMNLVQNPKTPIALSLGFMNRLQERDVHNLSKNKNIPDVIRKAAARLMITRRERGG